MSKAELGDVVKVTGKNVLIKDVFYEESKHIITPNFSIDERQFSSICSTLLVLFYLICRH